MKSTKSLSSDELNKLRHLFSLVLEDYVGNLDELMEMAGVDRELLNNFLHSNSEKTAEYSE